MPIFTKDGRSLLFIHVPKVAGTSLERRFDKDGWTMTYWSARWFEGDDFLLRRVSPQHYHGTLLEALFNLDRFDAVFTVVREPLARFRSEYAYRRREPADGAAGAVTEWTDKMLRPQHEFLVPRAHWYRLEDGLESAMSDLNERYDLGLPTDFPHALKSDNPGRLASRDVEIAHATAQRLTTFYAEDFAAFGYPSPSLNAPG